MTPMKILFCTGNRNKMVEFEMILKTYAPELLTKIQLEQAVIDLPELQGEPEFISSAKCRTAYEQFNAPVIVEDTSLSFNALEGLPGPYIKWFLAKLKPEGLYKMLCGHDDKTAFATTIFSYMDGKTVKPLIFEGRTDGIIVNPRGETTFGWDPIFQPHGFDQTYAEMTKETKNEISHRRKAADKIACHLNSLCNC